MNISKKEHVKNLVVGCGLSGMVVAERIASQFGESVFIIDKRAHIGGNIYDEKEPETGVTVHRYGPHVFHTNDKQVWDYVSRFTEWHPFMSRVKAVVDGTEVPVPFNLNSLHALFPRTMATRIEGKSACSELRLKGTGTSTHCMYPSSDCVRRKRRIFASWQILSMKRCLPGIR